MQRQLGHEKFHQGLIEPEIFSVKYTKHDAAYLGHEASITEAKKEASEQSQVLIRLDVAILPWICFTKRGICWNIQEHEEVGNHAENKAKHNNGIPAMLDSPVAHESKKNSPKHLPHTHNNST